MAQDPVPFIPGEPLATDGSAWGMRAFFKQLLYWAKRLCGVSAPKTASFTADENYFFPVDASGGAVTCTLPAAATWTPGKPYVVKKTDSSTNAVTVARTGSDLIDGATSVTISNQYGTIHFVSDGVSNWWTITGVAGTQVYQSGTWTPVFLGSGGNPTLTYTTQAGRYVRVGNLVILTYVVVVNTLTAAGLGVLRLGGFPFAHGNANSGAGVITLSNAFVNAPTGMASTGTGTSTADMIKTWNAFSATTDLANGANMTGTYIYTV